MGHPADKVKGITAQFAEKFRGGRGENRTKVPLRAWAERRIPKGYSGNLTGTKNFVYSCEKRQGREALFNS
jgi:hypothetical protein